MQYNSFNWYSSTFVFDTGISWKTITIFWWIHGNEVSWILTIKRLVNDLTKEKIKLVKWRLILALWNEKAIKINERDYKYNLNRLFKKEYLQKESDDYEIKRVKNLSQILNESDFLLDLHSVSSQSEAFIFLENNKIELNIAKIIWVKKWIIWWAKLSWWIIWWDTCSYMNNLWKPSITLEAWNHNESWTEKLAYKCSINILKHFWLIYQYKDKKNIDIELFEMYDIETTKTWTFSFKKGIFNYKEIKEWELIGYDWKFELFAKNNFNILLPNFEKTSSWEEIFYYWKKIKIPNIS